MSKPSKATPAVMPGVEKENLNSPPCDPSILRRAMIKSSRRGDERLSARKLRKRLGLINADQDRDNLNSEEENEIDKLLAETEDNTAKWTEEADRKFAEIKSYQIKSLSNQVDMMDRLATIENLMKSANPKELEKLRKEKDQIQRNYVLVTKQLNDAKAKIAALKKQNRETQDAFDRLKAGGKPRMSRPSTAASNSTPCYPQRTQGSITRHVGKERAMLNYQQSVNDGSVKQAPAFGPGRRHPNGEIALSKKDPFKL